MSRVCVVGSANVDQVYSLERIPSPGETVLASGFATARGGKGQNQAVAAARAGAVVSFIGAVGTDSFGEMTSAGLIEDGIDISRLRRVASPTGTAIIAVDAAGENTIIVDSGANATVHVEDADRAAIAQSDVLLLQLEIPLPTVLEAAIAARTAGTTAILNAAPMAPLSREVLASVDVLVVNEHEAAQLSSESGVGDLTELVPTVVVTLGGAGAELHERGAGVVHVPAPSVSVVDSTGAGDTFCGAFAAAVGEGSEPRDALRFAVAAASLSVQREGAVPSIPTRAEIDDALA
ncbi:ribokinase [Leifsonia sp. AK011]|uniref:ribokinase n=1 Tax=Leifsonia sp. AK011 TaxID=2723075 RepID=UPI0015CA619F|nr:ribokinase [Leifsonia sp. AK011]NYF10416.1 ribokinase [Leifsonia sp. AK011]